MAHNQMMVVRKDPPTFGHYRLTMLMQQHPDLESFVRTRGTPDFLAETSSDGRHYRILYYLQKRQAFACRTRTEHDGSLEFAGPYPITRRSGRSCAACSTAARHPKGEAEPNWGQAANLDKHPALRPVIQRVSIPLTAASRDPTTAPRWQLSPPTIALAMMPASKSS